MTRPGSGRSLAFVIILGGVVANQVHAAPASQGSAGISQDLLKLRDPFKMPVLLLKEGMAVTDIERYSVDQFRLVGVVTGPGQIRAMILDPSGKTHFIRAGDRIGIRNGRIRSITPDYVRVQEETINVLGERENVIVDIRLPEESPNPLLSNRSGGSYQ